LGEKKRKTCGVREALPLLTKKSKTINIAVRIGAERKNSLRGGQYRQKWDQIRRHEKSKKDSVKRWAALNQLFPRELVGVPAGKKNCLVV